MLVASLFFYSYWLPPYILLLICSIVFNFAIGKLLSTRDQSLKKLWLILGIGFNLCLLAYYKYFNFFIDTLEVMLATEFVVGRVILPLAISFFTFQQIAFLVDLSRNDARVSGFRDYALFVSFFPQLIAGPIVQHRQMLPQFARESLNIDWNLVTIGWMIFLIGLFKKLVLADNFAIYADPVFDAAADGIALTMVEAWLGALAYTFQLYFDFSGYSEMAIGLGCMLGFKLPVNFLSPYKATSIIDFWRRWHITLSAFLRDYLYISLGGNRGGRFKRYRNLIITMLLGGLWHGAAWSFVLWGAMHGLYLVINHAWRKVTSIVGFAKGRLKLTKLVLSHAVTFIAVVWAWVLFRSESIQDSMLLWAAMTSLTDLFSGGGLFPNGVTPSAAFPNALLGVELIVLGLVVVFFFPNVAQLFASARPYLIEKGVSAQTSDSWKMLSLQQRSEGRFYSLTWVAIFCFSLLGALALFSLGKVSPFLYFQF